MEWKAEVSLSINLTGRIFFPPTRRRLQSRTEEKKELKNEFLGSLTFQWRILPTWELWNMSFWVWEFDFDDASSHDRSPTWEHQFRLKRVQWKLKLPHKNNFIFISSLWFIVQLVNETHSAIQSLNEKPVPVVCCCGLSCEWEWWE